MKLFILVAVVVVSSVLAAPEDFHDTLDDDFDFTPLTTDQLREVSMCLCGDGKCTDLTASYKKHYPDIIIEACRRCNTSQKHISRVFFDLLKEKLPEELKRCRDKHDPQGLYFENYYNVIKNF